VVPFFENLCLFRIVFTVLLKNFDVYSYTNTTAVMFLFLFFLLKKSFYPVCSFDAPTSRCNQCTVVGFNAQVADRIMGHSISHISDTNIVFGARERLSQSFFVL
jgi:hypothetical protein